MNYQLKEHPLVSAVVPAYNAQEYIETTLQTLLRQSYPHLEIIVVDDGSIDRTAEIVKNLSAANRQVKLLQQANRGVGSARNLAIRNSRGSFIAPVDADDVCHPEKIARLLTCLQEAGKQTGLAYSWSAIIDQNGDLIGCGSTSDYEGAVFDDLFFSNFIGNASACLIRKDCFDRIGLYKTRFFCRQAQGCEDYDLFLRIAEQYQFKVVKDWLTGYRRTGKSMSSNYKGMEQSRELVFRDQRARNPWIPGLIFNWSISYYYLWLSKIAADQQCGNDVCTYLVKAAWHNPAFMKNPGFLKTAAANIRNCLKNPLAPILRRNYQKDKKKQSQHLSGPSKKTSFENWRSAGRPPLKKSALEILKEKQRARVHQLLDNARAERTAIRTILLPAASMNDGSCLLSGTSRKP